MKASQIISMDELPGVLCRRGRLFDTLVLAFLPIIATTDVLCANFDVFMHALWTTATKAMRWHTSSDINNR